MWIGRRARDKHTYPGMLDNMVAGGQPLGLSLRENLVKECAEEAAIPPALAERAVAVSAIPDRHMKEEGFKPDVQFCFDLALQPDFVPPNPDGEIAGCQPLTVVDVRSLRTGQAQIQFHSNT